MELTIIRITLVIADTMVVMIPPIAEMTEP